MENKDFYKKETLIAMVDRLMPSEIYNLCVVADGLLKASEAPKQPKSNSEYEKRKEESKKCTKNLKKMLFTEKRKKIQKMVSVIAIENVIDYLYVITEDAYNEVTEFYKKHGVTYKEV